MSPPLFYREGVIASRALPSYDGNKPFAAGETGLVLENGLAACGSCLGFDTQVIGRE